MGTISTEQTLIKATPSTFQSLASGSRDTIQLDATSYDAKGEFDTSTYTFTALGNGKYHFHGQLQFAVTATGPYMAILNINSESDYVFFFNNCSDTSADFGVPFSTTLDLSAGDTVKLQGKQNSVSSQDTITNYTMLDIELIGI